MKKNRTIRCIYWTQSGSSVQYLTMREIVAVRNKLREIAFKYLREHEDDPKCKHIVYYRDQRSEVDDTVWKVHFYCAMRPWDDDEFYRETEYLDGFVGAVHRHD